MFFKRQLLESVGLSLTWFEFFMAVTPNYFYLNYMSIKSKKCPQKLA